jgi:prepilin-type N-terminal cleavage/methylation domain-containing protein
MMQRQQTGKIRKAFTLIEMLVVLLIIGLLAAILFPVVNGAKERAYQSSCATNLQQIYLAVELYHRDVEGYPPSLGALLSDTDTLASYTSATAGDPILNTSGKGYFKGSVDSLICPDDDTEAIPSSAGGNLSRSSYGDLSTDISKGPKNDFGRYVWNFMGYRAQKDTVAPSDSGGACSPDNVSQCLGNTYTADSIASMGTCTDIYSNNCVPVNYGEVFQNAQVGGAYPYLLNPNAPWNSSTNPIDITKLPRLANRYAPPNTIITQCVFHRLPTSNVVGNYDTYNSNGSGQGAKGIVLRLDGTAKVIDVTTAIYATKEEWALQNGRGE